MIFVTVGTHTQPFERLLRAVEALPVPREELVVQHGHAPPPPGVRHAAEFMSFPEMLANFDAADVVITHAGVGSILCATNAGHTPIVVPRLKRHGEHVDDHQVHLIRRLEGSGHVVVAWDETQLGDLLDSVPPRRPPSARRAGPLQEAVGQALRARR